MPTVSVFDMTGKQTGSMELSDAIFGIEPNKAVLHSAVVNYLANQRQGTQSTLTRTEVSGRDYHYALPKKVRRLAMKSAFSAKAAAGDLIVLEALTMDEIKTKTVAAMLNALGADRKAILVLPEKNDVVIKSARNIPGVKTALVNTLNVYDILNADKFIVVKDAVAKLEEVYK